MKSSTVVKGRKQKSWEQNMALVTLQHSPSVPHCSNSDGESEDEEGNKNEKSECYFAGKDTALVLPLKDIPQHISERRLSTDSTRSTNSTQSNNSDIQQHLQSMISLLKPVMTLKMAVKVESQRINRVRYLVIASSCTNNTTERKNKIAESNERANSTTERKSKIARNNSARVSAGTSPAAGTGTSANVTARSISVDGNSNKSQQSQSESTSESGVDVVDVQEKRPSVLNTSSNRQSAKCDPDKNTAAGDAKCPEGIEESCLLGIDCNERTTIGLVVPILADTTIHLDGDGGFSVGVYGKTYIFKPVSVQAMWSALQTLHKVSQKARENNFYPGGPSHDWLSYYESRVESDQSCLNEWNAMDSLESRRPPSPDAIRNKPTAKEETESVIKMKLKEIMMSVDLDEVTSKYIRVRLEDHLDMDLGEFKSFIDEEMLIILGQMDAPTEIFEHVYLGSEWNASNFEELQKNGVRHILNVTREIDNFFPGSFDYCNVRVYDDDKTNLLKHWDNTYRYITRAKAEGSKVLVHCKMGVSRSASVVIAYAMKAYNWDFQHALQHVKERRNCIKPNRNFIGQLETYRGMLDAMKNKDKLQRSKSETNLKSTKDARLLPGSEPTPLIQALNQSKSKSAGQGVSYDGAEAGNEMCGVGGPDDVNSASSIGGASDQKQRRLMRRSSSTSPKSIQSHTAIVVKQQSQSLENLTPERSVVDEPKNMRFPGSNGENYSVTQNQVLHIQTPPPPPPPPPSSGLAAAPTSVRTIVHGLESSKEVRKTADDRKSLNLQFGRSISHDTGARTDLLAGGDDASHTQVSPVWTSSAKLITQTSNLAKLGSNSSIDSASSAVVYESIVRTQPRHREQPLRHASWGSGDNRGVVPMRNSSWGAYDTNRNSAIFEGQIHELNKSNKTVTATAHQRHHSATEVEATHQQQQHHMGTVKRTKQKLEECSALKKLCQENGGAEATSTTSTSPLQKRSSNLYRSSSAAGSTRSRYPQRCNSEDFTPTKPLPRIATRRSDGSKPLHGELFSASAPESYTMSDIENKNTLQPTDADDDETAEVMLRSGCAGATSAEDQRISGNVQILKKNFEAKAGSNGGGAAAKKGQSLPSSPVAQHADHNATEAGEASSATTAETTAASNFEQTTPSGTATVKVAGSSSASSSTSSSSASSVSEAVDRNVRGLVHKYQATSTAPVAAANSAATATATTTAATTTTTASLSKPRPRSYYESPHMQRSLRGRPHDYSDSRPPPAPAKSASAASSGAHTHSHFSASSAAPMTHDSILVHHTAQQPPAPLQQRRLQQHGKTHPLAKLPNKSFNAAAYNTM